MYEKIRFDYRSVSTWQVPSRELDSAVTAWVAAVVAAGGTVSGDREILVDNLVSCLKSSGVWVLLDRLWIFAADNEPSALIDMVALDQATAINTPTFTANVGYAGNGSTSYIDTTYNPSTNGVHYSLDYANISLWDMTDRAGLTKSPFGALDATLTNGAIIYPLTAVGNTFAQINDTVNSVTGKTSRGFFAISRYDSATTEMFLNGASTGTFPTSTSTSMPTVSFYVGGTDQAGTGLAFPMTDQVAVVSMGGALTDAKMASFYGCLLTYMGACGAFVESWSAAVVAAGGTVSAGRKTLLNALVQGLIADGIWQKLDRLWILAAENSQSALIDLVALDQATAVNSPTFTADRGYAGDGVTSYVDTTFNPLTQGVTYQKDSAHIGVWDLTDRAGSTVVATGIQDSLTTFSSELFPYTAIAPGGLTMRINCGSGNIDTVANNSSLGFLIAQRNDSSTQQGFYNGTSLGTLGPHTSDGPPSRVFYIGGTNYDNTLALGTTDQIGIASYGGELTTAQASSFYSRLLTYMQAIGAA